MYPVIQFILEQTYISEPSGTVLIVMPLVGNLSSLQPGVHKHETLAKESYTASYTSSLPFVHAWNDKVERLRITV